MYIIPENRPKFNHQIHEEVYDILKAKNHRTGYFLRFLFHPVHIKKFIHLLNENTHICTFIPMYTIPWKFDSNYRSIVKFRDNFYFLIVFLLLPLLQLSSFPSLLPTSSQPTIPSGYHPTGVCVYELCMYDLQSISSPSLIKSTYLRPLYIFNKVFIIITYHLSRLEAILM